MNHLPKLLSWAYLKKLLMSRTARLGMVVSALSFIQSIVPEFSMSVRAQAIIGILLGVAVVYLRMDTDHSIEDK